MKTTLPDPVRFQPPQWNRPSLFPAKEASAGNVLVLSDAIPNRNGVGTYYRDLCECLEGGTEEIMMIPARANCTFKHNFASLPLPGDDTQRVHIPHLPRIWKRADEMRPDVIVAPAHGPFGLLSLQLARKFQAKLIVGHHTSFERLVTLYWEGWNRKFLSAAMKRISRLMLQSADAVVVNTQEMAKEAGELGARRVHCMGTTIAKPFIETTVQPHAGTLETVFFAGRLAPEKNLGAILDAAARHPSLRFRIAGDGPDRKRVLRCASELDNVTYLGWLSREALLEEIDDTDLLILPSHIESFGSIALEGMARGRMVLVSPHCGILDWPDLASGLFAMERGEELSDALGRLRSEEQPRRAARANRARELARAMHERSRRRWLELLADPNS